MGLGEGGYIGGSDKADHGIWNVGVQVHWGHWSSPSCLLELFLSRSPSLTLCTLCSPVHRKYSSIPTSYPSTPWKEITHLFSLWVPNYRKGSMGYQRGGNPLPHIVPSLPLGRRGQLDGTTGRAGACPGSGTNCRCYSLPLGNMGDYKD